MRTIQFLFLFLFFPVFVIAQEINNTSYTNSYGEKVLRFEITVPANINEVWELFSTENGWVKWASPFVKIDLRINGKFLSSYDSTKIPGDPGTIILPLLSYLQNELIIFKVELNEEFKDNLREEDVNLQEVVQFIQVDNGKTRIISSMIGWGSGSDWNEAYNFFSRGNEWTYRQLLKLYY